MKHAPYVRPRALLKVAPAFLATLFVALLTGLVSAFGGALPPRPACLFSDGRLTTANTYSSAKGQNASLVGQLFSKLMLLQTSNKDILGQMEGPEGSGRPIVLKTDLKKGAADTVNFSTVSRPGGEGAIGENLLEAEQLDFGSYPVTIDFFRHGLGMTEKIKTFLAAGMSIEEAFAEQESDYFALRRQADLFMMWRQAAASDATLVIRPNDRSTDDSLLTTDVMNTTLIEDVGSLLKSRGAPAAKVDKKKKGSFSNDVLRYIILASDRFLKPLRANSTYLQALETAEERGNDNVIWAGGYADWDGQMIMHMDVVREDTRGPLGAPIEPEALLGVNGGTLDNSAVTDATTITVQGGGRNDVSTVHLPFKWFKGYAYQQVGQAAPSADSGVYYFVIYNVSGSGAGKFGIYKYTGSSNVGTGITCSQFLGATGSGTRVTTLAGITWDSNKHTNVHPTGSRIIQVNAKCVPYCYGVGLGANSGLRAYGGPPIKPIKEDADWHFKKGLGFQAIYGQGLAKDTTNAVRNYTLIVAAYRPQGLSNLPTVLA